MKQETKKKKYDFEIADQEDEEVDGKETFSEISFQRILSFLLVIQSHDTTIFCKADSRVMKQ